MLAGLIMPLLLAMLLALLLEAPVAVLGRLYGSRQAAAAVVFGAALAALLLAVGLGVSRLFAEAQNLLSYLTALDMPEQLGGLPLSWESALADWGVKLLASATDMLRATPELMLSFFVTVVAAYYLLAEPDLPLKALCLFAPVRLHAHIAEVYAQTLNAFAAYLRAQAVVMLQTFGLSVVGLKCLNAEYVLLPAVFIALLDMLPMIGPGALLLPMAGLVALQGDTRLAVGVLLLLLAIIIGRQITEPRIMGKGLGLHPLASLLAGFVGLAVFGALGLVIGPLLVSLLYMVKQRN